ncbi:MAG: HAMP domain-containing sensor histidine kinase [Sphingorhabdus sp.]
MSGRSNLASPIRGEIACDGRLIRADDALQRLNRRAGGEEGGALAIPPLASLAQLTLKLQMRLSRAVRVADETENLELWVEAQPRENIAHLSILSWRILPAEGNFERSSQVESGSTVTVHPSLLFDPSLRLIRANGAAAEGLSSGDFGSSAVQVMRKLFEQSEEVLEIMNCIQDLKSSPPLPLKRIWNEKTVIVTGMPVHNVLDESIGYECRIGELLDHSPSTAIAPVASTPSALFGKHLAPVLRQPLGRIIANAETIGSELQGPIRENYAAYARDIANAARHLSALVDDLGDLEAVEREDFRTANDKIELGDVARRVAGLLALKAADHSIRISCPPESQKVPAVAEFRRVLQIMLNLVTNAIRYSPDGTEVRIDIQTSGSEAVISVSDQGAGIAEADRAKVFEKFERLGRSGDGGSGLGLYISRRLAQAMGGDLSLGDAASGGAKFTLRLPSE